MKIDIIKVNQDDNIFYVGKIKARDLVNIATTKVRKPKNANYYNNYLQEIDKIVKEEIDKGDIWYLKNITEDPNIQRKQSKARLKEIGEYISKSNSMFPNAIIVNLSLKDSANNYDIDSYKSIYDYIEIDERELRFDEKYVVANIIDGQHRLGGFEYTNSRKDYLDKYELIITIMIGLEPAQQAELFATINGKQKSVNKSVLYDLSAMSKDEYSISVTAHLITTWFNINEKSPLNNKIKMLGVGEGTISQAAVIEALVPLMQHKKIKLTDDVKENMVLPIFYSEFKKKNSKKIIKNLYNYFKCISSVFSKEWEYQMKTGDEVKYILNKTTGVTGLLIAYCTIYCYQYTINDFEYGTLLSIIDKLKNKNIDFSSDTYSGGSKQLQKKLANDIISNLFDESDIIQYRNNFIRDYLNEFSEF